ncbi:Lactose regulatory protein LAC9-like protein 4, partial [Colletotrichum chlorophyti]
MEKRLANIESLLVNRQCSCLQQETQSTNASTSSPAVDGSLNILINEDVSSAVEGSSSIKSPIAIAQKYAESVTAQEIGVTPAARWTGSVSARNSSPQFDDQRSHWQESRSTVSGFRNMPLPLTHAVVGMLKRLKENPPRSFSILRCFMPVSAYIDICRNVYFSVDDYSDTEFIIANYGLYSLFTEYFCPSENADSRKQHLIWGSLCKDAMTAAVGALKLCLPAEIQSVHALAICTGHAIEVGKPWLGWRLACYAAQLCIAAGFHDEAFMSNDEEKDKNAKILLFWYVYAMEKGLALRLGRASVIPDCDITLTKDLACLSLPKPWSSIIPFWTWNASMHSRLYESLYSRSALAASKNDVSRSADSLLSEMKAVKSRNTASHTSLVPSARISDLTKI